MSSTVATHATYGQADIVVRPAAPTAVAGTDITACDGADASTSTAAAEPAQWLTWQLRKAAAAARWHARRLHNLARRHGSRTEQQRRRLFDSVVRHVNAGDIDPDEANAFLHSLGIGPAAGPGEVSFRVRVAMAMIHEDVEGDIGTLQYRLEESEQRMWHTRLDGYPNGFHVARPSRADVDTGRRHTVVSTDLRLTVTVPAYTDGEHRIATATAMLCDDLTCLPGDVDIVDEPGIWNRPPGGVGEPADIEADPDGADGGWAYLADEFDEGNYINYGLDIDPFATDDDDADDEVGDSGHGR